MCDVSKQCVVLYGKQVLPTAYMFVMEGLMGKDKDHIMLVQIEFAFEHNSFELLTTPFSDGVGLNDHK